jgi:hypothetical protein
MPQHNHGNLSVEVPFLLKSSSLMSDFSSQLKLPGNCLRKEADEEHNGTFVGLTLEHLQRYFPNMKQWTTSPGRAIAVLGVLVVVALIQILPQVDLPFAAFHEDSAPVAIHARAISPPVLLASAVSAQADLQSAIAERAVEQVIPARSVPNFLPIFYRSIRV